MKTTFVQNVNKKYITQRRRQKKQKEDNSSFSFYETIKCNNNVNDSNKNVTNFFPNIA